MTNKLITPQFMEAIKNFPLYSQEEKGKDAICVAIFTIISVPLKSGPVKY